MDKEKTREHIRDYVLLMLGAPVLAVELDQQQLDLCIDDAFQDFEHNTGEKLDDLSFDGEVMSLIQMESLSNAKIILGRIRCKANAPGGRKLFKEGLKDNKKCYEKFLEYFPIKKDKKVNDQPKFPSVIGGPCPEFPPIEFGPVGTKNIKGLLVIYINVGQLPPFKAEAFVERIKDKTDLTYTKQQCEVIYIPTRDRPTQVEYIAFGA